MEQFGKEIEKVLKAGIGAVKSGVEMGADAIEKWAEKGEPLYEAAKSSLCDAAGKLKKAVDDSNIPENFSMMLGGKVTMDTLKSVLSRFNKEELDAVRQVIDDLYGKAPDACCDKCTCADTCDCDREADCSDDCAEDFPCGCAAQEEAAAPQAQPREEEPQDH